MAYGLGGLGLGLGLHGEVPGSLFKFKFCDSFLACMSVTMACPLRTQGIPVWDDRPAERG